mmetsp:Transcript_14328/g.21458  ORF Transcript_14328/g.21458 Transcript_14328/m.21458 type:complete len:474 (+) Transcript_14328:123-1544(+)|eukprot:CAMPEP_0185025408 /NCGR_PEP_ID=MMETSP1103-20130426/8378_1 /TAXON_ID=36769 /ORGANISM="Paraphysomonas bandaiensis, Strain Caron Lab Isolate" /LENGTH=473 /DNA_ID=CAMNT_0027558605 /DNA_START=123 /DNA_END=1544 /DNA_ORIENTATION=-
MSKPKKYIFVNGVMKLNPEYSAPSSAPASTPGKKKTDDSGTLAVVSSMADVAEATEAQETATGTPMQLSASTAETMQYMQGDEYLTQFHSGIELDGGEVLDGLTEYFVMYEVPIGMINKLRALSHYKLNFIIDDSGSMRANTDVFMSEGTEYILRGVRPAEGQRMTRWQEAENRMHIMLDILAFIPTKQITISFLNATNVISLSRDGKSIETFRAEAHGAISNAFSTIEVKYKTPTYRVLSAAFASSGLPEPTMHYLLTDGVPSDQPVAAVAQLIMQRPYPDRNPLTLMSCTNEDAEVEWMKQIEETAPFTSELDDYHDEKEEVLADQGSAFPYTKGFWIISSLVASINPDDLDAIDENLPFTKHTLDDLLGRTHSPEDYQFYFERNPHAPLYVDVYSRFLNEPSAARAIVSKHDQQNREHRAGYRDGKPPSTSPSKGIFSFMSRSHGPTDIGAQIRPITEAASRAFKESNRA